MTFRAKWRTDQELLSRPAGPSKEEFNDMLKEIHAYDSNPFAAEEESSQAFIDSTGCTRWGRLDDKCIRTYGHTGPCEDAQGRTTLTLAADILRGRK
jgi:hypothetical protein